MISTGSSVLTMPPRSRPFKPKAEPISSAYTASIAAAPTSMSFSCGRTLNGSRSSLVMGHKLIDVPCQAPTVPHTPNRR